MPPLRITLKHAFLITIAAAIAESTITDHLMSSATNNRLAARTDASADGSFDGCHYQVEGVGTFTSHLAYDFTTMDTLPDDLVASTYEVGSGPYAPYAHIFNPSNIVLTPGQPMQMIVPGGQAADPLETCQVVTRYNDVLYASVRTIAQASPVNGTVHGFFMYMNDTQETDIEIRTGDPGHVHFTNQQTHPGNGETTYAVSAPATLTTEFHEYRYDWLPTGTYFYIDGQLVMSITRNVPSEAGWLMWNSWSNGYAWTYGPPLQDSILHIRSVEAFFNRTSVSASNCEANSARTTRTEAVRLGAGAHATVNTAAVSSQASTTTEIETSSTNDGTFSIASTLAAQSPPSSALPVRDIETCELISVDTAYTNISLQTTITIGIAFEPIEALVETTSPIPAGPISITQKLAAAMSILRHASQ
ncbi:concanavalin A-like lectin/glucanase [Aureobasidium subglaciale]|nr:concanavalin A-like lectin/glucanase [Aureobasidium subglaciale]